MRISSPPVQFDNPEFDMWMRDLYSGLLSIPMSETPPTSSTDEGVKGQMAYDDDFLYVCYAENLWKRVALVAF